MRYRKLGKTGLRVSEIGLGGEWLEGQSDEAAAAVISRAEEMGVNILDCWMSNPAVRKAIGRAIRHDRERWIIQGHLGSTWQNGQYVRTRDPAQTERAFQDLLSYLQTSYIDLGMIHYVDSVRELDSILNGSFYEYTLKLREEGKIRHIGLSTHNAEVGLAAARSGKVEMILFACNPAFDLLPPSENLELAFGTDAYASDLFGIDPVRKKFYETCEENGVGMTIMKGYAGGRLFSAQASPFGVPLTAVQCIHYGLTRPAAASFLAGCKTPAEVDAACAYETAKEEEKDYASVLAGAPKHAFSGQCTYCGHCQPCPAGIHIAEANRLYDLAAMHDTVPATVKDHYLSLEKNAYDCIGCRSCESRCPFGVKIADKMAAARELFSRG